MGTCKASQCKKKAYYAENLNDPALYCGTHAEEDWPNVVNKRCSTEGCPKRPTVGPPGGKSEKCVPHAPPGWVSKHKKCDFVDAGTGARCTTRPNFSYPLPGATPRRCARHALPQMENVTNRRCNFPGGCDKLPHYAQYVGAPRTMCKPHGEKSWGKAFVSFRVEGTDQVRHATLSHHLLPPSSPQPG